MAVNAWVRMPSIATFSPSRTSFPPAIWAATARWWNWCGPSGKGGKGKTWGPSWEPTSQARSASQTGG